MTGKAGLVPWKRLYVKQLLPSASAAAERLPWPFGPHVCVCNLVFNIPLYATQAGYDSGLAEGGGVLYTVFPWHSPSPKTRTPGPA